MELTLGKTMIERYPETAYCRMIADYFGLESGASRLFEPVCRLKMRVMASELVYITGPSGSGKSLTLAELSRELGAKLGEQGRVFELGAMKLDEGCSAVDQPCFSGASLKERLRFLNRAGLSEARVWIRQAEALSGGERYRCRLAGLMYQAEHYGGQAVLCADEFGSQLDMITAAGLGEQIRRWCWRTGGIGLLAGCDGELIEELRPDTVILRYLNGDADVYHPPAVSHSFETHRFQ